MKRRDFLKGSLATLATMSLAKLDALATALGPTQRMPALFVGHGSPMNAVQDNPFTRALRDAGQRLPTPRAALVVSAHWYTRGTFVSTHPQPPTIHDFGGFPRELYQQQYPAPGAPEAARQTIAEVKDHFRLHADGQWGLDHGAWAVLKFLFPQANVPVFQLSLDSALTPARHFDLGRALRPLRDKGILIIGSGNLTHNFSRVDFGNPNAPVMAWAEEFDSLVANRLRQGNHDSLANLPTTHPALYREAAPTPDHYWPALYAAAAAHPSEAAQMLFEGFQHGSISMRAFGFGV
jgi:4,5-DOPA dioxygenase extradiol